ncbi:hypothetical protein BDP67DRAFT_495901 [Colletotrichum lupini]|nr:hypothetical protein BDP67DRAFT_495901 [Colletotrichum lupini]
METWDVDESLDGQRPRADSQIKQKTGQKSQSGRLSAAGRAGSFDAGDKPLTGEFQKFSGRLLGLAGTQDWWFPILGWWMVCDIHLRILQYGVSPYLAGGLEQGRQRYVPQLGGGASSQVGLDDAVLAGGLLGFFLRIYFTSAMECRAIGVSLGRGTWQVTGTLRHMNIVVMDVGHKP